MSSCCPICTGKCVTLVKTYNTVKRIVRWIAICDAVAGILVLTAIIAFRSVKKDFNSFTESQRAAEIFKLVVLCLFGLQILFSLILHEGARREILWMIKAWLIFSLIRLTAHTSSLTRYLISSKDKISKGDIEWVKILQIVSALYGFLEAVIILIFHHHIQTEQDPESGDDEMDDNKGAERMRPSLRSQDEERLEFVPMHLLEKDLNA